MSEPSAHTDRSVPNYAVPGFMYRHRKGGLYNCIMRAKLEVDETPVVVYQSRDETGQMWVRPEAEFLERFEIIVAYA